MGVKGDTNGMNVEWISWMSHALYAVLRAESGSLTGQDGNLQDSAAKIRDAINEAGASWLQIRDAVAQIICRLRNPVITVGENLTQELPCQTAEFLTLQFHAE